MRIAAILIILLLGFTSFSQPNCKKFKTGKFQNIENGKVSSLIERNETSQIETVGDIKVKLQIVWINACTYRLKFIKGNEAFWKSRPKNAPTPDLIVTITKTNENSYFQEAKSEGSESVYKSEMRKVQ